MTTTQEEKRTYNVDLQNRLKELIASGNINQSTLAKSVNYSAAVISTYLKSDYNGDLNKLETALEQFLQRQNAKEGYKRLKLDYCLTSIAQDVNRAAKMSQYNCDIGVCIGKSGMGKSMAIKGYAEKTGGVIIIDPDEKTRPKAVLKQFALQLKLPEVKTRIEDLIADIVSKLKDSRRLVIIDEAENLDVRTFRILRKIHDRSEDTFGMLFVGTETLYANLLSLKGEYAYIANRIARVARLNKLTTKDVEMLVKQVFPSADSEIVKHFEVVTENNARILFNTLKTTKDFVNSGLELNKDAIISARPGL